MTRRGSLHKTLIVLFMMQFVCIGASQAKDKQDLTGTWELNEEETEKHRDKNATVGKQSRFLQARSQPDLSLPPMQSDVAPKKRVKQPAILNCDPLTLQLNQVDSELSISMQCNDAQIRSFTVGKLHGRVTKWNGRRLYERYSSLTRSVTHEFKLTGDDRMEVRLNVKPSGEKKFTYVFIYDRVIDPQQNESA